MLFYLAWKQRLTLPQVKPGEGILLLHCKPDSIALCFSPNDIRFVKLYSRNINVIFRTSPYKEIQLSKNSFTDLFNRNLSSRIPFLLSLWRGNTNTSPLNPKELKVISNSLLNLQRGLTGNRELAGAGYMEDKNLLGSYLLYYWPVTYMQISSAAEISDLKETVSSCRNPETLNILDLGSGPAPASFALCDLFGKVNNVTLVDSSSRSLNLAKKIYNQFHKNTKVNTLTADFEKFAGGDVSVFDELRKSGEKFNLIVMSHALNELWKEKDNSTELRTQFLLKACELMEDNGILILNEPALLKTSRALMEVSAKLLREGFSIKAPCLCSRECPALRAGENQTCHSDILWKTVEPVTSIANLAKLDRNSVKMTFFVLQKNSSLQNESRENIFRVVSEPMLNKAGRIRYVICDGKKRITVSAKKNETFATKIGFFKLKRMDLITLRNPELRGEKENISWGIKNDTELCILNKTVLH